jgi:hypothetical protein
MQFQPAKLEPCWNGRRCGGAQSGVRRRVVYSRLARTSGGAPRTRRAGRRRRWPQPTQVSGWHMAKSIPKTYYSQTDQFIQKAFLQEMRNKNVLDLRPEEHGARCHACVRTLSRALDPTRDDNMHMQQYASICMAHIELLTLCWRRTRRRAGTPAPRRTTRSRR